MIQHEAGCAGGIHSTRVSAWSARAAESYTAAVVLLRPHRPQQHIASNKLTMIPQIARQTCGKADASVLLRLPISEE